MQITISAYYRRNFRSTLAFWHDKQRNRRCTATGSASFGQETSADRFSGDRSIPKPMQLRFSKSDIESHAPNVAGVYLVCRSGPGVSHLGIYVGQSENIATSLRMQYEKASDQSS